MVFPSCGIVHDLLFASFSGKRRISLDQSSLEKSSIQGTGKAFVYFTIDGLGFVINVLNIVALQGGCVCGNSLGVLGNVATNTATRKCVPQY
jgi:hypothetical protein